MFGQINRSRQRWTNWFVLAFGLWTLASSMVALAQNVAILTWGGNSYGQLGDGTTDNHSTPIKVLGKERGATLSNIKAIAGGEHHTIALRNDGTVVTWGYNEQGQLGDGTTTDRSTPVLVKGVGGTGVLDNIKAIAGGGYHTVALRNDGGVVAWGYNRNGEAGGGMPSDRSDPIFVKGVGGSGNLTNIKAIASGGYHTIALRNDGTLVTWGYNFYGALGDGTTSSRSTPIVVKGVGGIGTLTGITAIAAGHYHTVALRNDGSVVAWGTNDTGQLGDDTTSNRSTPVEVLGVGGTGKLTKIVAIAATAYHTIALRTNGSVVAWGYNFYGALGDGTTTDRSTPIVVKGVGGIGTLTGITAIAAGHYYTVALRNDGRALAWGWNSNGQLGDGTTTDHSTPVEVLGVGGTGKLTGITAIAAGVEHTIALKEVSLFGTITLLDTLNSVQPLTFTFRNPNSSQDLFDQKTPLDPDGNFSLLDVPDGDYLLAVKGSKWLRKTVPVTVQLNTPVEVHLSLIPGDANDDNSVNIFDLATLAEDFNSLPGDFNWNDGHSDFNCDDGVDIYDLAVLAQYFNTDGDP